MLKKLTSFHQPFVFSANAGFSEQGTPQEFKVEKIYEPRAMPNALWVQFGDKNQFPQWLIEQARSGTIHYSLLLTKQNMIKGEGFEFVENENEPQRFSENEIIKAQQFFKAIELNSQKHAQICWDMCLFGGSFPQLVFGKNENANTQLKKIIVPAYKTVRLGMPVVKEGEEVIDTHFYHKTWGRNVVQDKPVPIKAFSEELYLKGKQNLSYLVADLNPLMDYYPRPDYMTNTSLKAIMLEERLMDFDLSDLQNGMSVSGILTIYRENFEESDPEKELAIREKEDALVKEKFQGVKNNGRIIIQRVDLSDANAEKGNISYTPIETNNKADRHTIITQRKDVAILSAHGVPMPDLAGIPNLTNSGFSSQADMLSTALQVLYHNRILPLQQTIENFYNHLLALNEIFVKVKIKNNLPLMNYVSDSMWTWAFTKDEYRKSVGYPVLTEEQKVEKQSDSTPIKSNPTNDRNRNV